MAISLDIYRRADALSALGQYLTTSLPSKRDKTIVSGSKAHLYFYFPSTS
jgi:hypothetical protein